MKKSILIAVSIIGLVALVGLQSVFAMSNVNLGMRARPFNSMNQQMIQSENGGPIYGWINSVNLQPTFMATAKGVNGGKNVPSWDLSKIFRADGGGQLAANFGGFTKLRVEIAENMPAYVWKAPFDYYAGSTAPNHPIYNKYIGYTTAPSILVDRAPVSWTQKYGSYININTLTFDWPETLAYDSAKAYRFRLIESTTLGSKTYSGTVDSIVYPQLGVYANLQDTVGPRLRINPSAGTFSDQYPTTYKFTQTSGKDQYDLKILMKDNGQLQVAKDSQDRIRATNATRYQGAVNWIFGSPYFTQGGFMSGGAVAKTLVTTPMYDATNKTWSELNIQMPVSPWQDYESGVAKYRVRLMEIAKCNETVNWSADWVVDPTTKDRIITYKTAALPESAWADTAGITTVVDRLIKVDDIPTNLFGPVIKLTKTDYDKLSANVHSTNANTRSCAFVGITALDNAGNQTWDGLALFLNQVVATQSAPNPTANPVSTPNTSGNSTVSAPASNTTSTVTAPKTSSWTGTSSAQSYSSTGQIVVNQAAARNWVVSSPTSISTPAVSAPVSTAPIGGQVLNNTSGSSTATAPVATPSAPVVHAAPSIPQNTNPWPVPTPQTDNMIVVPIVSTTAASQPPTNAFGIPWFKLINNFSTPQASVSAMNIRSYLTSFSAASTGKPPAPPVPPIDYDAIKPLVFFAGTN